MERILTDFISFYAYFFGAAQENGWAMPVAVKLVPFLLLMELPYQLLIAMGVVKWWLAKNLWRKHPKTWFPSVSCVITCYSEGYDVRKTIRSLLHQRYPGIIEIIPVIDGSVQNAITLEGAQSTIAEVAMVSNRELHILAKKIRGGRVSSLNSGLVLARHEIIMALDGDTSFDNDMVANAVRHFRDINVVAVSGNLRVRISPWFSNL